MTILPVVCASIPFVHADGSMENAPFQIFRLRDGRFVIRIGNNTLWFSKGGRYTGTEHKLYRGDEEDGEMLTPDEALAGELAKALEASRPDTAPSEAYFPKGSPAYEAEIAGWPRRGLQS